jgi:RNA polymerase sigma-70 factor (ECF subfamily)
MQQDARQQACTGVTIASEVLLPPPATEADFEALFAHEYRPLVQTLFLLTGSNWEAEDLAQEALACVYERWDRVRRMESPLAYLYTVATNLHRRRVRRFVRRVILQSNAGEGLTQRGPEDEVEARSDVLSALASLPLKLREALVLAEWLDLDSDELGRRLGIAASSARARVHRARAAVRDRLGGTYE